MECHIKKLNNTRLCLSVGGERSHSNELFQVFDDKVKANTSEKEILKFLSSILR